MRSTWDHYKINGFIDFLSCERCFWSSKTHRKSLYLLFTSTVCSIYSIFEFTVLVLQLCDLLPSLESVSFPWVWKKVLINPVYAC